MPLGSFGFVAEEVLRRLAQIGVRALDFRAPLRLERRKAHEHLLRQVRCLLARTSSGKEAHKARALLSVERVETDLWLVRDIVIRR